MNQFKKLGKNVGQIAIGSFASRILTFLLVPLYTAILSTEEYGIVDVIQTTINLLIPLLSLVIYESVLRFALEKKNDISDVFTVGLIFLLFSNIIMFFLSPIIFLFEKISPYYWYFVTYFFVMSCYSTFSYFCRGIEKITIYSISGVINSLLVVGFYLLFLLKLKLGIRGYLLANILAFLFTDVFLFVFGRFWKYIKNFKEVSYSIAKQMVSYSFPLTFNSISWWISGSIANYIIIGFVGLSAAGIYSVAGKIPSIISILGSVFSSAWLISAVEDFGTEHSKQFYSKIFALYTDLCVFLTSGLILLSKLLGSFLYSNEFFEAWKYTPILSISVLFHVLGNFIGSVFSASKKTKPLFYSTLVGASISVLASLVLVKFFGNQGAAIATMISYLVVFLYRYIASKKVLDFKVNVIQKGITFGLLLIEAIVMLFDCRYSFIISISITIIIFIINMNDFKTIIYNKQKNFIVSKTKK